VPQGLVLKNTIMSNFFIINVLSTKVNGHINIGLICVAFH